MRCLHAAAFTSEAAISTSVATRPVVSLLSLFLLVGLGVPACGEADPEASRTAAIAGGNTDTGDTAVVGIVLSTSSSLGICSGSLISPNVVLTARHCVSGTSSEAIVCEDGNDPTTGAPISHTTFTSNHPANEFYVTTRTGLSQDPSAYTGVAQVVYLPEMPDAGVCGRDVAMLVLDTPITSVTPLTPRDDWSLLNGESYSAIGYGGVDNNGNGTGERRRLDGLIVQWVGLLAQPGFTVQAAGEWLGDHGVCQGDSGGPAFDAIGNVVGVVSRGAPDCSSPIYGRIDAHGTWLRATVIEAAGSAGLTPPTWATSRGPQPAMPKNPPTEPPPPPPPPPPTTEPTQGLGDDCTTGSNCVSGVCIGDGVRQYCTQACDGATGCPEGYVCAGDAGVCVTDPSSPVTPVTPTDPGTPPPTGTPDPAGLKANGQACALGTECASGSCDAFVHLCTAAPLPGQIGPRTGSGCSVAAGLPGAPTGTPAGDASLLLGLLAALCLVRRR